MIPRPPRSTLFPYTTLFRSYSGVLILISHDRQFVNSLASKVADVDYETIIVYNGNYDAMVETKAEARSSLRSEEHTSELQSRLHLVCRLLLEKKKQKIALPA